MKKICIVTTVSGTLKSFVVNTAKYLTENADIDVTLICNNDPEFAQSLPSGIHYIPVPMKRGISLDGFRAIIRLIKIFRRNKYDMVQYSTPNASLYSSVAAWLAGIPVRLYCQWGMVFVAFSGLKRVVFKLEEKLVCALSTEIEPDSRGNLDYCHRERIYPLSKGRVIWNGSACGVDLNKFDIAKKSLHKSIILKKYPELVGKTVMGFVGRLDKDKGCNELFAAFRELCNEHPELMLLFVGSMDKPETIDPHLLEYMRSDEKIIKAGRVDDVERYLSVMDVFALPSYREGFGMSVIEAEAMGVAVAVSDVPGPTDAMISGKTGVQFEARSVKALKEALEYLIQNRSVRERMGAEGVNHVRENFDAKTFAAKLLEDRKRLLGLSEEL